MGAAALGCRAGVARRRARLRAETLRQALAAAYKFNPRLDAARATQRATDEEVPRALSGYRPSVNGSADTSYEKQHHRVGRQTFDTNTESNPRGYTVGLVQPLFRGFRTVNAVNAAEATVRAGWETLRTTEAAVLLEAVTAYGDVVRDTAIVRLRENNVTVLTRDLRATQDRFNVGEVTRTDVAQAQARRAAAVAALDLASANLKTSRATFERVIGHPPSNLVEARATNLIAKSIRENVEISARESPIVVSALYREQAARFAVDLIRGELLPTVQLEANYTKRFDPSIAIDETETTLVTGRVTVPFYTGGEVQARVRQAKHTHIQRLQEIEQARTEVQAAGGDGVVAAGSGAGGGGVRHHGRQCQPHRAGRRARGGAGGTAHAPRRAQRRAGAAQRRGQPGDRPAQRAGGLLRRAVDHRTPQCAGAGHGGTGLRCRRRTTTTCAASGSTSPSPTATAAARSWRRRRRRSTRPRNRPQSAGFPIFAPRLRGLAGPGTVPRCRPLARRGVRWCSAPASAIEWRGLGLGAAMSQRTRSGGTGAQGWRGSRGAV